MTAKTSLVCGAAPRALMAAPTGAFNPMLRGPMVAFAPEDGAGGGLSVEQAVAALDSAPETPEEAAPEEAVAPEEITSETSADAEPADQAENLGDGETEGVEEEQAATPLDPPLYWKPEAKDAFAKLPPELQAVVLEQEGPREAAASKAKAEAAQVAQAAEKELVSTQTLARALSERIPQWLVTFEQRWGTQTPDWSAVAQEHGVEAMTLAKLEFDKEAGQLREALAARHHAEALAEKAWTKAEAARLAEIAPDLADPERGGERLQEIAAYAITQGVEAETLSKASAAHFVIARKAMLYDRAQAALKAAPTPKPAAQQARGPVRPAAAAAQLSPKNQQAVIAKDRFVQTRSIDDAVALLSLRG